MITNRPKKAAIQVTETALHHLKTMMTKAPENAIGIRLGLKNAGCAGMAYIMDYATDNNSVAEIVDFGDVKIMIDTKSLLFLLGMEMDYQTTQLKSGFVFNNPNQTDACGCGESVKLVAVESNVL